MQQKTGSDY